MLTLHTCSQYLGVKQSIFEKKQCRYYVHSQYFGLCTADTASSCSISRFCTTADTSGLAAFRDSLLWILPVLQTVRVFVLRALHILAVFRSLVLRVLRVLAVPKHSQHSPYACRMKYTWTICAACPRFRTQCFAENIYR